MPYKPKPDITAVLNAHREGSILYPSIASMLQAIQYAEHHGLSVEMLIVLDQADAITEDFVKHNCPLNSRIEHIEPGDLSKARNYAISQARGSYIAFLDGDDLWCKSWLIAAFIEAKNNCNPTIYHPEVDIYFGSEDLLVFRRDMCDPEFNLQFLNITTYWSALSFAHSEIYQKFSYQPNDLETGFGYEDWQWNCETIYSGILHMVVPGTAHFIRRKTQSSLEFKTRSAECLMTPSNLFNRSVNAIEFHNAKAL